MQQNCLQTERQLSASAVTTANAEPRRTSALFIIVLCLRIRDLHVLEQFLRGRNMCSRASVRILLGGGLSARDFNSNGKHLRRQDIEQNGVPKSIAQIGIIQD